MAYVELVIKLSEKNCEYLRRLGALWVGSENGSAIVSKALLEGTILPKGHKRLIEDDFVVGPVFDTNGRKTGYRYITQEELNNAPTIIEAYKVESEE